MKKLMLSLLLVIVGTLPASTGPEYSIQAIRYASAEDEVAGLVMGFSHEKTTHHFRLYADGGAIEAEANDAKDTASQDQIRSHFGHIVTMFAAGNFSAPMLIHAQNPPGTEAMKRLRNAIEYKLESTEKGARIRITSKDPDALRAIHEFLRFQITDHQTGDSPEVTKVP